MIMGWIFAGGILLLGSIYDARRYCLPLWLVILGLTGGGLGFLCSFVGGEGNGWELLAGMLPGALTLGLALLTREQIGYGDGLLLMMLGGCLGSRSTLSVWFGGLLTSFVISIVLLTMRKAGKNSRIPFVPCLFLGYVIVGIGGLLNGLQI